MKMKGRHRSRLLEKILKPLGHTRFLGTITSVITDSPAVALTFDDGPDPTWTPLVLDVLKKHAAKATFFVLGENCERYPEIINRTHAEGHALCNHGWSHSALPPLSWLEKLEEISSCSAALGSRGSRYFRPPFGEQSVGSRLAAAKAFHF